ncbi:hypothetical protein D3C72_1900690 [compost metagenome]
MRSTSAGVRITELARLFTWLVPAVDSVPLAAHDRLRIRIGATAAPAATPPLISTRNAPGSKAYVDGISV